MENQIPTVTPTPPQAQPQPTEQQGKRKIFVIGGTILAVIIVGIIGYLAFQMFSNNSSSQSGGPTADQDVLLATVGSKEIYKSQVVALAREQYQQDAITDEVLKTFFNKLIEWTILDTEAQNTGITVTDEEINEFTGPNASTSLKQSARYQILQDKIMAAQTKNVEANTIGFWIPSYDYPQEPEYETQRAEAAIALQDMMQKLQEGQTPLQVAQYAATQHPTLPKLSLNGYILAKTQDTALMQTPKIYVLGELDPESTSSDPDLYDALKTVKAGDVIVVMRNDGSGGSVVQIVNVTTDGYATFDEFLAAKTADWVTIVNPL